MKKYRFPIFHYPSIFFYLFILFYFTNTISLSVVAELMLALKVGHVLQLHRRPTLVGVRHVCQ